MHSNIIDKTLEGGSEWLHEQGYNFLKDTLYPTLAEADAKEKVEVQKIADIWCILGDIHRFNDAPKQAIEAFKRSNTIFPNQPEILEGIAVISNEVGDYKTAFDFINQAIAVDPEDEEFLISKQQIQDNLNYDHASYFSPTNLVWKYNELLAAQEFEAVTQELEAKEALDVEELKCLACAYGAQDNESIYREIWVKVLGQTASFELTFADWFYMPRSVFEEEAWLDELNASPLMQAVDLDW